MLETNFRGLLFLFFYYLLFASFIGVFSILATNFFKEGARKAFHLMVSLSVFVLLRAFSTWYFAALALSLLLGIAALLVWFVEKFALFKKISIARARKNDILKQIAYFLFTIVLLLGFFWGLLGPQYKYLAALGILAWGFGDAAAALIGKRFGKRKFKNLIFDHKKTVEGFWAMSLASGVSIFLALNFLFNTSVFVNIVASFLLGIVAAFAEAVSKKGLDTVTIPLLVSSMALPLLLILSFMLGQPSF